MAVWLLVLIIFLLIFTLFVFYKTQCDLALLYYSLMRKNLQNLQGQVVWITGASSGIGEALSYTLAKSGAKLILSARRKEKLAKVLEKCNELSPSDNCNSHMVLDMDILDYDSHRKLAEQVFLEYGKIDYLVNNAGISQRSLDEDTKLEVIDLLLKTNTLGSISLTKAVLPYMVRQKSGCLVYTSSIAGKIATPGSAGYSASKHALQGYLDTLRIEVSMKGIHVLSICPGPVHGDILREVLGNSLNKESRVIDHSSDDGERVSVDYCVYLMAISMVNRLEEVWISKQPILLFGYISQYMPTLAKRLGKRIGTRRMAAIKSGKKDVDSGLLFRR